MFSANCRLLGCSLYKQTSNHLSYEQKSRNPSPMATGICLAERTQYRCVDTHFCPQHWLLCFCVIWVCISSSSSARQGQVCPSLCSNLNYISHKTPKKINRTRRKIKGAQLRVNSTSTATMVEFLSHFLAATYGGASSSDLGLR